MTAVFMMLGVVSAAHTSDVDVSPSGWLKPGASYPFEFTVSNTGGDAINDVTIDADSQFGTVTCEPAPTGWTLTGNDPNFCRYTANTPSDYITSGNNEVFEVTAPTLVSLGTKTWAITTREPGLVGAQYPTVDSIVQTIQNAIDADTNGTVTVPAGTYEEQLIIDKSVNLIAQPGTTIITPDTLDLTTIDGSSKTYQSTIFIDSDSDEIEVTIEGFSIDADNFSPNQRYSAILIENAKATIKDNEINNILVDGKETFGILSYGNDVVFEGNTISTFSRGGIGVYSGTAVARGNVISGPGPDEIVTWAPNGIQFGYDTVGTIEDNEVSGCGWPGEEWEGTAILVVDTRDVEILNNNVHDNELGIGIVDFPEELYGGVFSGTVSNIDVIGNTLTDNSYSMEISNDVDGVVVEDNIISNSEYEGISVITYEGYNGEKPRNVEIHSNIFEENPKALEVGETIPSVDATNNYWGVTTEDVIQALIEGDVDFDPWWYDETGSADTTAPTIVFNDVPYFSEDATITIDATITDERDIASYVLDFGDGSDLITVDSGTDVDGEHDISVNVNEDHTYVNGDWTVSITAYDGAGNYFTKTTSVSIDDTNYDWVISLSEGWNLISFPMIPTDKYGVIDRSVNNVFSSIMKSMPVSTSVIFQYDAMNRVWKKNSLYSDGSGFYTSGSLKNVYPGYAYWVKVDEDTVLKGFGRNTEPAPSGLPPSIELGSGWNLIGKFGDNPVLKEESEQNLIFDDGFRDLGEFPIMHDGTFLEDETFLVHYEGYWALLSGNNGNPITYTVGAMDYI